MAAGEDKVVAGQWTIADNGQKLGPYSLDQMKQMVREGRMPPEGLVWTPGMSEWKPWRQTPEIQLMAAGGGWAGQFSQGQLKDYLVFRKMILPIMIQIQFWVDCSLSSSVVSCSSRWAWPQQVALCLAFSFSLCQFSCLS